MLEIVLFLFEIGKEQEMRLGVLKGRHPTVGCLYWLLGTSVQK